MSNEAVFEYCTATTEQVNVDIIQSSPALDDFSISGSIQVQRRHPSLVPLVIPNQGSEEYKQFNEIMKGMKLLGYNTIHNIPWHIRREVEDLLNKEKDDKNDWRGMGSRLGVKTTFIDKMEQNPPENPCKEVFEQKSNEKADVLVQALYKMERRDVLDFIHAKISEDIPKSQSDKQEQWQKSKFPSQETTPESSHSTGDSPYLNLLSLPVKPNQGEAPVGSPKSPGIPKPSVMANSPGTPKSAPGTPKSAPGTPKSAPGILKSAPGMPKSPDSNKLKADSDSGRMRSESNPKQHSDATDYSNGSDKLDFHSNVSKQFWESIPPNPHSTRKEWKQLEKTLIDKFPEVSQQSQLLRLICYILKVEYDERHNQYVSDQDFANMVAWFGPLDKDGCLGKMSKLIKESVAYNDTNTGSHSFFAGYMSKADADRAIKDSPVGTFLIRLSSTYAKHGRFVLVLKTEHGPEHHIIEQQGNPYNGTLTFGGETYDDITQLYKKRLRKGGVSADRRTSCVLTCPNLPLNPMFRKYNSGPLPISTGRGRGRTRVQPQQNI